MRTRTTFLALAICLSAMPATLAQSRTPDNTNFPPATPREATIFKQTSRLHDAAEKAMSDGNFALAERDARKAISLGLTGVLCQDILAAALNAEGKEREALHAYQAMADAGDTHPDVLLPYALLLLKNGQNAKAADAYHKALPNLPYSDLMQTDDASLTGASQSSEIETDCHLALGLVYYSEGIVGTSPRYDLALDQFQKALQLTPNSALAKLYSAYSLNGLGMKTQAKAAFAKAAAMGQGDVSKQAADAMNGSRIDP